MTHADCSLCKNFLCEQQQQQNSTSSMLIEPLKSMPTNQMKMETLYILSANRKLSVTATDESLHDLHLSCCYNGAGVTVPLFRFRVKPFETSFYSAFNVSIFVKFFKAKWKTQQGKMWWCWTYVSLAAIELSRSHRWSLRLSTPVLPPELLLKGHKTDGTKGRLFSRQ